MKPLSSRTAGESLSPAVAKLSGGELPAETFRWLMSSLHEGKPPQEIRQAAEKAPASVLWP